MSQENVEIVKAGLQHLLATGELMLDTTDQNIEVFDHEIPEHGDYRGHEGLERWLEDWGGAWAEWSLEPEEFIDAGDQVMVIAEIKGDGTRKRCRSSAARRTRLQAPGGKITRLDYYNSREQAFEAAGLSG